MAWCGPCGEPNQTTVRNGRRPWLCLRMNCRAASTMTMELSPWVCTASPVRLRMGSLSKKLGAESHSSKPLAPGFTGLFPYVGPRCHLPKCPLT